MTYSEAIDWLYSTQQFGIKLGLDQPRKLLRETLAFPASGVKVIHVAGTNGKGSTCAIIDSLARACGIRTGLFTSPHLIDYRERIQVSGQKIPEKTTAHNLTELRQHCQNWKNHPTFFELTLAVAMRHFREQQCELIILETGMGGRLDATTAVPADLAAITPIAMDHSQWLGDTLEAIAAEKAGIIVPKKPVVSSLQEPAARCVIEQKANELRAPLEFITEPLTGYSINLPGSHQQHNAALAIAACHHIKLPLTTDSVRAALNKVTWPGRFEKLSTTHYPSPIILDGAHNPHAANTLVETWKQQYPDQKATLIFGAVEGKNTDTTLSILAPIAKHIHLTPIDSPRSLTPKDLIQALPENAPPHTTHNNLKEALTTLGKIVSMKRQQKSEGGRFIETPIPPTLICGSLFLIGQAKALLTDTTTRSSIQ